MAYVKTDLRVVVDIDERKYLVPLYVLANVADAVGCFSKSLVYVMTAYVRHGYRPNLDNTWLLYTGQPSSGTSAPARGTVLAPDQINRADWSELPPNHVISHASWWSGGAFVYSALRNDPKVQEGCFSKLVSWLEESHSYGLFVIGDNLRDSTYDTKAFVDFLMRNKIGSVTCSPAVINPAHSDDPRYCMAWFWVPPWNMERAIPVPQEHVNLVPKRRALSGYPEVWKARLQAAKPAMKPRTKKKDSGSGELNQVSNV